MEGVEEKAGLRKVTPESPQSEASFKSLNPSVGVRNNSREGILKGRTVRFFNLKKIYLFMAMLGGLRDLCSPIRDRTCAPLQWKRGVLTTGPPGKPLVRFFDRGT